MNILFCTEGFIIDGVASYNLYLSTALQQAGHHVAVVGRWSGRGYQTRHRRSRVAVLQSVCFSSSADSLVRKAVAFKPDVIITDARRAFPLTMRIRQQWPCKVLTIFHDPPQQDQSGSRGISSLIAGSDVWLSPERPIVDELVRLTPGIPVHFIQRPLTSVIGPAPLPFSYPLRILCLSRLSRWKIPGLRRIIDKALYIRHHVPHIEITVIGGGWRRLLLWMAAQKANLRAGRRFIHIIGPRIDPLPWIHRSHLVCAGATSAIEAILAERPVIAFSGFWMGLVTEENLAQGIDNHFGERRGDCYVRENPDLVVNALIEQLRGWDSHTVKQRSSRLRLQLSPQFEAKDIVRQVETITEKLFRMPQK